MRLNKHDRRVLERFLKSMVPPNLGYKLRAAPLTLLVSITLYISPSALAQVSAEQAKLDLEQKSLAVPKAEEPKEEDLEVPADLGDQISSYLGNLFVSVKNDSPSSDNLLKKQSKQYHGKNTDNGNGDDFDGFRGKHFHYRNDFNRYMDELRDYEQAEYNMRQATYHRPDDNEVDGNGVSKEVQKNASRVALYEATKNLEAWQKIKKGFDFKLNFNSLFAKKEKPKKSRGKVRYGLILKDVKPDTSDENKRAALGAEASELQYAGAAEVEWTIGPIYEDEQNKKPFNADIDAENHAQEEASDDKNIPSLYTKGVEPGLKGNVRPAGMPGDKPTDDVGAQASAGTSGGALPGVKIMLSQEQELHSVEIDLDGKGKRTALHHQFKLPIIGEFSLGRRYNDRLEVVQTSMNNIFVAKTAPKVSLHYMDQTKQKKADVVINEGNDYVIVGGVQSKANVEDEGKRDKKRDNERYWIEFIKDI